MTNNIQSSENEAYLRLVEITDGIVAERRSANRKGVSRQEAFAEACKQRPDLANDAVRPGGQWVNPQAHADQPPAKDKPKPPEPIEEKAARLLKEADERRIGTKR